MITLDLREAIQRAAAGQRNIPDPKLRPAGQPGRYATSIAFGIAAATAGTRDSSVTTRDSSASTSDSSPSTPRAAATSRDSSASATSASHSPAASARAIAGALAERLSAEPFIESATVTGGGFVTIVVTWQALAQVADRVITAGPACTRSDILNGVTVPAPPGADWARAPTWEHARATLAAQLTARLAIRAGAIPHPSLSPERILAPPPAPPHLDSAAQADARVPGTPAGAQDGNEAGRERAAAEPGPAGLDGDAGGPVPGGVAGSGAGPGGPAEQAVPGAASRIAAAAGGAEQRVEGGSAGGGTVRSGGEVLTGPVGEAIGYAGADAVRFALARAVPGRPVTIDPAGVARQVPGNPAYAVRYAHARAVSGLRWAAPLGATGEAVQPCPPADPAGWALLDALSWLPERVAMAARRGRPDEFARYLEDLASAAITALPFPGSGHATAPGDNERLALTRALAAAARTGLAAGLDLLGVSAPQSL